MRKETLPRLGKPQTPKVKKQTAAIHLGRPFTMDDALWSIVGIGKSKDPTDVSTNKSKYLADAYDPQKA